MADLNVARVLKMVTVEVPPYRPTDCEDLITEHLYKARESYVYSEHAQGWSQPRVGIEKAVRDSIRGWAYLADVIPQIKDSDSYGRYFSAQGLALRALIETQDLGRLSKSRLHELVIAIGECAGIDWRELDGYEDGI